MCIELATDTHRIHPRTNLNQIVGQKPAVAVADRSFGHLELARQFGVRLPAINLKQFDQAAIQLVERVETAGLTICDGGTLLRHQVVKPPSRASVCPTM